MSQRIRAPVFWPPALILLAALAASLIDFDGFLAIATTVNNAMLARFGWLFVLAAFAAVILCTVVFISPLGAVRIGGADARPILKRWNWFAITLCTTIATGILFWGAAEPMFHVTAPPAFANLDGQSDGGAQFALSTLYLHWAVTPYAIYATCALAFALSYYNRGGAYSLSAPLKTLIGARAEGVMGNVADAFALFALTAGVAASLGAGVMTLSGGLEAMTGAPDTIWTRLAVTLALVGAYVISSASGLQRGIKILSDINIRFFFAFCAFVLLAGPTLEILKLGLESAGLYVRDFLPRSLGLDGRLDDPWTRDWTIFYFANWLAWAPITALFLGRIAIGYTVREFLLFNLVLPALFGMVWMTVFGGAAILLNGQSDGALAAALDKSGPEAVIYALFEQLPWIGLVTAGFLLATFISFVTAMDSNTHAIAGVSSKGAASAKSHDHNSSQDHDGAKSDAADGALAIKLFWGILIGAVSWVMTATNGIDGVRMLSNLGGAPGLVIMLFCAAALMKMIIETR